MKIEHQVVNLDDVLHYYAKGFEGPSGSAVKPQFLRAFVDISQRLVVFELSVESEEEEARRKETQ